MSFGVFMYFPTLVEVPVAQMFLDLGMHRGPLLAYLISDPELSLQSILITVSIIGRRKAMTYVGLIALFSTLAGLLYGAWVDQTRPELLLLALVGILGFLALTLFCLNRRIKKSIINAGVTPVGFSNPVFREFENERKSPRPLRNICPSLHKTR